MGALSTSNEQRIDQLRTTVEPRLTRCSATPPASSRDARHRRREAPGDARGEARRVVPPGQRPPRAGARGSARCRRSPSGVGDLKKVLANVKTRGTWGEVQLQQLLDQVLAPEQYAANVVTREGSDERVEFAIRLPGRGGRAGTRACCRSTRSSRSRTTSGSSRPRSAATPTPSRRQAGSSRTA